MLPETTDGLYTVANTPTSSAGSEFSLRLHATILRRLCWT